MIEIKMSQYINGNKVISGRDNGKKLRDNLGLSKKDNDKEVYKIIIPNSVYSFNSSCFLGMFGESIKILGEEKFREKYVFESSDIIKLNIEDGINDAKNCADTLR